MVKGRGIDNPEIIFYSRLHINKRTGQYSEELTARVIERDEKGRFKSSKLVKADAVELTKLQEDIAKGKKSLRQAKGILTSLYDKPLKKRLQIGKDNFYNILVDSFKKVSDKDRDIIEAIFNQMSIEDFNRFYQQNKELSNKVYGYGGFTEKDKQYYSISGKEVKITHAPLSPDAMEKTAKDVINQLKKFYNISNEEITTMLRGKYYDKNGRRIIDGRIYNWGN